MEVNLKLYKNSGWFIVDFNWQKNCIFKILAGKKFLKLFLVLILQNFWGKSIIVVCEVPQNFKTKTNALIGREIQKYR